MKIVWPYLFLLFVSLLPSCTTIEYNPPRSLASLPSTCESLFTKRIYPVISLFSSKQSTPVTSNTKLESYLFEEGGLKHLNDLLNNPLQQSVVLNQLIADASYKIRAGYSDPITNEKGERLPEDLTILQREHLKMIDEAVQLVIKEQVLDYQMYEQIINMYQTIHQETISMFAFKKHKKRFMTKDEYLGISNYVINNLQKNLSLIHKGEIDLFFQNYARYFQHLVDNQNRFLLVFELDYLFFAMLGADFRISGVAPTPFIYYDFSLNSAIEFTKHDGTHDKGLQGALNRFTPSEMSQLSKISAFLRKNRHALSPQEREIIGAYLFVIIHEIPYLLHDYLFMFYPPPATDSIPFLARFELQGNSVYILIEKRDETIQFLRTNSPDNISKLADNISKLSESELKILINQYIAKLITKFQATR